MIVFPAEAGIQKNRDWMPHQVRHDMHTKSKPRPRVKRRGIGGPGFISIHPRDKSRGFLRGGVKKRWTHYKG